MEESLSTKSAAIVNSAPLCTERVCRNPCAWNCGLRTEL